MLLPLIDSPIKLRSLKLEQLPLICQELRNFIIEHVSLYGGHFGANLGTVELTVALHYIYNTPKDRLVWDVGHQAYCHKIITGRADRFHTNRLYKGLSGFPKPSESIYDTFGVGHSSTSISAALGMAYARDLNKSHHKIVAVIGDGGMTAGLAFEGLNNLGYSNTDMLIVLNDNQMAIDHNVGSLHRYLVDIVSSKKYLRLKEEFKTISTRFHRAGKKIRSFAHDIEKVVATALTPGGLFKQLGFHYFGPVNGHNVTRLCQVLKKIRRIPGPKLLHVLTVKGKGFKPAEQNRIKWHAQSTPFNKYTGSCLVIPTKKRTNTPTYSQFFGQEMIYLAAQNKKIVCITPAMCSGSGLVSFFEKYPHRSFDVGIAEQHAVTYAAGLAKEGMKPYVAIYSTFLQRAYDQVIHDVAIQKLPVIFCIDRAGLVGADGPTHHGVYDIAYLRAVPNLVLCSPFDSKDFRDMLYTASFATTESWAIRYPRGCVHMITEPHSKPELVSIGKSRLLRKGSNLAILSYGPIGHYITELYSLFDDKNWNISHYDMRFAKPLDENTLNYIGHTHQCVLTLEDGCKQGGFGSSIAEYYAEQSYSMPVKILGIPDRVVEHGTQLELHQEIGIDPKGITLVVGQMMKTYCGVMIPS